MSATSCPLCDGEGCAACDQSGVGLLAGSGGPGKIEKSREQMKGLRGTWDPRPWYAMPFRLKRGDLVCLNSGAFEFLNVVREGPFFDKVNNRPLVQQWTFYLNPRPDLSPDGMLLLDRLGVFRWDDHFYDQGAMLFGDIIALGEWRVGFNVKLHLHGIERRDEARTVSVCRCGAILRDCDKENARTKRELEGYWRLPGELFKPTHGEVMRG